MKRAAVGIPGTKKPRRRSSGKPDTGRTMLEKGGLKFIEGITRIIRLSDSMPEAAASLELDHTVLYDWQKRGEAQLQLDPASKSIFATFAKAIKKARADFVLGKLALIQKCAQGDESLKRNPQWQPAAWLLERRRPEFRLKETPSAGTGGGVTEVRFITEAPAPRKREKPAAPKATPQPAPAPPMHPPEEEDDE